MKGTVGWTLVIKADGNLQTFSYSKSIWTDRTCLNPTSTDRSTTEHKNKGFYAIRAKNVAVQFGNGPFIEFNNIKVDVCD